MMRFLLACICALGCLTVQADPEFKASVHYEDIIPAQPTKSGDKIEVVELFWYGCPHCFHFEPFLSEWLKTKPDYVEFRRIPAVFAQNWLVHARAYYAAEALGVGDKLHRPLFNAIHQEERKIMDEDSLVKFAASVGIDEKQFRDAYDSFAVDGKVRQAMLATKDYGITGVPSVIVNGKYRVSPSLAGNYETLLKIVDFLVAKEKTK